MIFSFDEEASPFREAIWEDTAVFGEIAIVVSLA
jgi:hypothetical protein